MIERGRGAGFLPKTAFAFDIAGKFARQNLDGDAAVEFRVVRQINFAHSARADFLAYFVSSEFFSDQHLSRKRFCLKYTVNPQFMTAKISLQRVFGGFNGFDYTRKQLNDKYCEISIDKFIAEYYSYFQQ